MGVECMRCFPYLARWSNVMDSVGEETMRDSRVIRFVSMCRMKRQLRVLREAWRVHEPCRTEGTGTPAHERSFHLRSYTTESPYGSYSQICSRTS